MLAVERRTTPILRRDDSLDRRKVMLAERVVLRAIKVPPPSIGFYRFDPNAQDFPTYERRHLFRPIPPVKKQSVAVVRTVIDGYPSDWHEHLPSAYPGGRRCLIVLRLSCLRTTQFSSL